jgi:hypothetical protein
MLKQIHVIIQTGGIWLIGDGLTVIQVSRWQRALHTVPVRRF